jgi:hypothetical protein
MVSGYEARFGRGVYGKLSKTEQRHTSIFFPKKNGPNPFSSKMLGKYVALGNCELELR